MHELHELSGQLDICFRKGNIKIIHLLKMYSYCDKCREDNKSAVLSVKHYSSINCLFKTARALSQAVVIVIVD